LLLKPLRLLARSLKTATGYFFTFRPMLFLSCFATINALPALHSLILRTAPVQYNIQRLNIKIFWSLDTKGNYSIINPHYSWIFYSKAKLPAIIENACLVGRQAQNMFSSIPTAVRESYNSFTKKFLRFPISSLISYFFIGVRDFTSFSSIGTLAFHNENP